VDWVHPGRSAGNLGDLQPLRAGPTASTLEPAPDGTQPPGQRPPGGGEEVIAVLTLASADERIRQRMVHGVLEITLHLYPDQVAVAVHDGVVTLRGGVECRSRAEEVERIAASLDGVAGVESRLRWERDDRSHLAAAAWS